MSDLLSGFLGWDKQPDIMDPTQGAYPPPPKPTYQEKPTHFEATGLKYNAYNIDKLSVDITNKTGFNNITPDMLVWSEYHYDVKELIASADEGELSKFLNWSLTDSGIENLEVDFSEGGETKVSGKYKGIIPFSIDISVYQSEDNKMVFSFNKVKALVPIPDMIRDTLIDALLNVKEMPGGNLHIKPAFVKVGSNKIVFDPQRINPKVNLPIKFFETTDTGMTVKAGTNFFEAEQVAKPQEDQPSNKQKEAAVSNFFKQGSVSELQGIKLPEAKTSKTATESSAKPAAAVTAEVKTTTSENTEVKSKAPAKQVDNRVNDLMNINLTIN